MAYLINLDLDLEIDFSQPSAEIDFSLPVASIDININDFWNALTDSSDLTLVDSGDFTLSVYL